MRRERELPVHCCCEPGKRLGYLTVREDELRDWHGGRAVRILPRLPVSVAEGEPIAPFIPSSVLLRVRLLNTPSGLPIEAIDSGHCSVSTLRMLPGWRDV